jgi:hypothetical protein
VAGCGGIGSFESGHRLRLRYDSAMPRPNRRGMVNTSGSTSDPKKITPIHQLVILNPKYTNTMPMPIGMRSVMIHTHHTSP